MVIFHQSDQRIGVSKMYKVGVGVDFCPLLSLSNYFTMISAALRASVKRSTLRATRPSALTSTVRQYSSAPSHGATASQSSATPWAIGSLLVFGPILFQLTAPPPKEKKHEQHQHAPVVQPTPVNTTTTDPAEQSPVPVAATAAKKVQKPYVLIGAGTASFAAAQAIKESDPEANVSQRRW
jgi:programmed cell death 8 (apoptosis-inducing factor)